MSKQAFLNELEAEFAATQNLLETVPANQLEYRPHPKSMTLGQLALHVASIPGRNLGFAKDGSVETNVIVQHPFPVSKEDILGALANSREKVNELLGGEDAEWLNQPWNLLKEGQSLAEIPTAAFVRTFVLNHWYHHRGQLSVYLRILNQEIPSIYGPSADVNPFA
ncbi:MAG: DinB family protein [Flavobacteriales bacterium]|nr:DinB family protein [Flavobacteriales bacterium]